TRCEYSCAFQPLSSHTRLRVHWAPGIPHALFGAERLAQPGRNAPRECEAVSSRHCEERKRRSNPAFLRAARWIASLALAMTVPWSSRQNGLLRKFEPLSPYRPGRADAL